MLLDRFIRYVKIDTQSDEDSELSPSTLKQYDLLKLLKKELDELGIENELDEYGRLYAHIPGNNSLDAIGLCSHVDTALECSGKDVNPQVINNYDLSDIALGKSGLVLSKNEYKKLNDLKGKTLITTDGTTLLGADDKAGLAIIMETAENVLKLPINERHPMSILFTPDEEIGRGPEHFDAKKFGCKFAYTIDGASPLEISYENFNAKAAKIEVIGRSIHPGSAKGIMINASLVLAEFINALPKDEIPAKTEGKQGFNHLCYISGSVEKAEADYIIRNHSKEIIDRQVQDFKNVKSKLEKEYPGVVINLTFKDQYQNMYEVIKKHPECLDHIKNVFDRLDLSLVSSPTRGGTDGATFSYLGVPTPNLGTGSYNHHGRFEFAVLEEMELMVKIATEIYKK